MPAAELRAGRLVIHVRLTPKASGDRIDGFEGERLRVRVRALPSDGEANAALLLFLGKTLRLPKSALHLTAGAKSREKTVVASGDPGDLQEALRRLETLAGTAAS